MSKDLDVKSITKEFFLPPPMTTMTSTACWALCADGRARTIPSLRQEQFHANPWRPRKKSGVAFRRPYRTFGVEIVEMIPRRRETPLWCKHCSAERCRRMSRDLVKKGEVGRIAHAYIIRYNADGKNLALGLLLGQHRHQRNQGECPVSIFPEQAQ